MKQSIRYRLLSLAALLKDTLKPELIDLWKNKQELSRYNKYLDKEPQQKHSILKPFKIKLTSEQASSYETTLIKDKLSNSIKDNNLKSIASKTNGLKYLTYLSNKLSNDYNYLINLGLIVPNKDFFPLIASTKKAVDSVLSNKGRIPPQMDNTFIIEIESNKIIETSKTQLITVLATIEHNIKNYFGQKALNKIGYFVPPSFFNHIESIKNGEKELYLVGSTDPNDVLTMASRGKESESCMNLFKDHYLPRIVANLFDTHSMIVYITDESKTSLTGSTKIPYKGPNEWNSIIGRSILRVIESPTNQHFLFLDKWYGLSTTMELPHFIIEILQSIFSDKVYKESEIDSLKTKLKEIYLEIKQEMPDLLIPQKNVPSDDEVELAPAYNDTWSGHNAELKEGGRFAYINSMGEIIDLINENKSHDALFNKYKTILDKQISSVRLAFLSYLKNLFRKYNLSPEINVDTSIKFSPSIGDNKLVVKINISNQSIKWDVTLKEDIIRLEANGPWLTEKELAVFPFKILWSLSDSSSKIENIDFDWESDSSANLQEKLNDSMTANVYQSLLTLIEVMKKVQ